MKPRKPIKSTQVARGKPLERKSPMPRTGFRSSAGNLNQGGQRSGPVKARSESTHIPKPIRKAVLERDAHTCQRCGRYLVGRLYSLQHRDPRGAGGSKLLHTMANLVTLCGTATTQCHGNVESHRLEAKALGWLIPDGVTPEEWPVRRWTPDGPQWMQPAETWTSAVPHPRQREAA